MNILTIQQDMLVDSPRRCRLIWPKIQEGELMAPTGAIYFFGVLAAIREIFLVVRDFQVVSSVLVKYAL